MMGFYVCRCLDFSDPLPQVCCASLSFCPIWDLINLLFFSSDVSCFWLGPPSTSKRIFSEFLFTYQQILGSGYHSECGRGKKKSDIMGCISSLGETRIMSHRQAADGQIIISGVTGKLSSMKDGGGARL